MMGHMAYVQYGATVLISSNRLSVLLKYNVFEPVWREYTWVLVILVYFLPFLDTYRYFVHTAGMKYYEETEGYTPISSVPINDSFAYLIPFMIISTICSVALNITSLLFVRQVKLRKKNRLESNFLIIMSITCTAQLFGMILSVSRVILAETKVANTLAQILPFVSDGLTLVQPWLLVVFCHSVRDKMMMTLGLKKSIVQAASSQILKARSITT